MLHGFKILRMVLLLDGSSELGAHIWSKSGISMQSFTSTKSSNPICFGTDLFYFIHGQPSRKKTRIWIGSASDLRKEYRIRIQLGVQ